VDQSKMSKSTKPVFSFDSGIHAKCVEKAQALPPSAIGDAQAAANVSEVEIGSLGEESNMAAFQSSLSSIIGKDEKRDAEKMAARSMSIEEEFTKSSKKTTPKANSSGEKRSTDKDSDHSSNKPLLGNDYNTLSDAVSISIQEKKISSAPVDMLMRLPCFKNLQEEAKWMSERLSLHDEQLLQLLESSIHLQQIMEQLGEGQKRLEERLNALNLSFEGEAGTKRALRTAQTNAEDHVATCRSLANTMTELHASILKHNKVFITQYAEVLTSAVKGTTVESVITNKMSEIVHTTSAPQTSASVHSPVISPNSHLSMAARLNQIPIDFSQSP